ncbi:MAG: OmpA family protein [Burkholderiaceae bacterium]|nr:OmpA family protein [Burkholderiaceae bacterium]
MKKIRWSAAFALCGGFCAVLSGAAWGQTTRVPTQDMKGLTDPSGLKRYSGAVLVYRDDVAYDEVRFPAAKVVENGESKLVAARNLERAGQRTALQYVAPAGRSTLEVLRGYQQEQKAAGFDTAFECAGDACGGSNIFAYSLPRLLLPAGWTGKVGDNSPAACASGTVSDLRYALLDNKASGATLAVLTWNPDVTSVYCDEKEFQKRTTITVVRVEPKAREQQMETLSSSEIAKGLDANGKVAIYGILFDTGKADSKASLDQIGGLLKQQTGLKLHVVGHTDNVGALPVNLDLSRRRADAVAATLTTALLATA